MSTLDCLHQDPHITKYVCAHILETQDADYMKYFIGIGLTYHLICRSCAKHLQESQPPLKTVCESCFNKIEEEGYWDGIVGRPEVFYESSRLSLVHHMVQLSDMPSTDILEIQPLHHLPGRIWIGLNHTGSLLRIDFDHQTVSTITNISSSQIDLTQAISLHLAPDGSFAVLTNTLGNAGIVFDLNSGKQAMSLQRDAYHSNVSPFSVAFFLHDGKVLLIHATAWNRLDISDLNTGELLTVREPTSYRRGEQRPEHYLDYFHGRLVVSPTYEWVADDGWVWNPVGCVSSWNIHRWVEENPWESEDGRSLKRLCWRDYFWGGPLCWINGHTLAVWGYGGDDEWLIPAVRVFDVISGDELRWFAGVEVGSKDEKPWTNKLANYGGALIFDKYLYAYSEKHGISVWNPIEGTCLFQNNSVTPVAYHRGSQEFLSLLPKGTFCFTRCYEG